MITGTHVSGCPVAVRLAVCGVLILACCRAGLAQAPQPAASSAKATAERLAQRIDELQSELRQMKEQLARMGAPAAAPAEPHSTAQAEASVMAPAPARPAQAEPGSKTAEPPAIEQAAENAGDAHRLGPFLMRGFADLGWGRPLFEKMPDGILRDSTNSFTIGDFDLFTTARISEKLSFMAELLITSDFSNEFGAEIDRMMLTYKANDYFRASLGKFNTAIGYYSNAFHRARYFQTATGRPLMFADEDNGGMLPIHSVGLTTSGRLPSGPLGLHWVAEVTNGRASRSLSDENGAVVDVQNFADENNAKAVNFALLSKPPGLHGFEVGVSFYRDKLRPLPLPDMSEHILSAHVVFVRPRFEFLNEMAMVRHAYVEDGHVWNSVTGYSQLSQKFGSFRPYFRYDYQNTPRTEPLFGHFGQVGRADGPSFGLRYDMADYAGLKLQYGRLSQRDLPWTNDFQIQIAFAF